MRKRTDQRIPDDSHREKTPKKSSLVKKLEFKSDNIRQLNTEGYLDLLPSKKYQSAYLTPLNLHCNLPEFIHFKSDHLVLTPQFASCPFFGTTKFNRQLTNNNNNNISPTTVKPSNYTTTKRLSRSRHSCDTNIYHTKQQQQQQHHQRHSMRPMPNKFDSVLCFNEVSR
jgi:hypothetical protein